LTFDIKDDEGIAAVMRRMGFKGQDKTNGRPPTWSLTKALSLSWLIHNGLSLLNDSELTISSFADSPTLFQAPPFPYVQNAPVALTISLSTIALWNSTCCFTETILFGHGSSTDQTEIPELLPKNPQPISLAVAYSDSSKLSSSFDLTHFIRCLTLPNLELSATPRHILIKRTLDADILAILSNSINLQKLSVSFLG
jgi:hypothetical protein